MVDFGLGGSGSGRWCGGAVEEGEEVGDEGGLDGVGLDGAPVEVGEEEVEVRGEVGAVDDVGEDVFMAVDGEGDFFVGEGGLVGVLAGYEEYNLAFGDFLGEYIGESGSSTYALAVDEVCYAGLVEGLAYTVGCGGVFAAVADKDFFGHGGMGIRSEELVFN